MARAVWSRPRLRAVTIATTLGHFGDGGLTLAAALLTPAQWYDVTHG